MRQPQEPRQHPTYRSANETLIAARKLGVRIEVVHADEGDNLWISAPPGVMTLDLQQAIKMYKETIIWILQLPKPAKPGEELERLRREIGEMARELAEAKQRLADEAS